MVTLEIALQPLLSVYVIELLPLSKPETSPLDETVAIDVFDETHGLVLLAVPDPVSCDVEFLSKVRVPEIVGLLKVVPETPIVSVFAPVLVSEIFPEILPVEELDLTLTYKVVELTVPAVGLIVTDAPKPVVEELETSKFVGAETTKLEVNLSPETEKLCAALALPEQAENVFKDELDDSVGVLFS